MRALIISTVLAAIGVALMAAGYGSGIFVVAVATVIATGAVEVPR